MHIMHNVAILYTLKTEYNIALISTLSLYNVYSLACKGSQGKAAIQQNSEV